MPFSGYDGSIRIDSSIDTKGFNKGIDDIVKSASKAAGVLGRALSEGALAAVFALVVALRIAKIALTGLLALVGGLGLTIAASVREFYELEGSVQGLKDSLKDLRNAFAIAFAPLVSFAIPYIQAAISWLIKMFNTIAMIVGVLLGQTHVWQAVEGGAAKAAATADTMAKNTEKVKKAAQGALAAFDQINVLQQPTEPTTPTAAGAPGTVGALQSEAFKLVPILDSIRDKVEAAKKAFFDFFAPIAERLAPHIERLKRALEPLGKKLWAGLVWIWENVLVPLGKWTINELLPALLDLLSAALEGLNVALDALGPLWDWFWTNVLKPLAEWSGDALIKIIEWFTERIEKMTEWIQNNEGAFRTLVAIVAIATVVFGVMAGSITAVIVAVFALVAAILWLVNNWDVVKQKAWDVWTTIKQIWFIAGWWFWWNVADPIRNAFLSALTTIKDGWIRNFTIIRDFVKGIINSIIDLINGMIRAYVKGLNAVIGAMNSIRVSIPSWVPEFGGQSFGLSVPYVTAPTIPRLAQGAVIPPNAQFAAVLGDQRSGRNLEAPEGLIRQIIREEIGQVQADIKIEFVGSLAALVRELAPKITQENVRIGGSLVSGGITK